MREKLNDLKEKIRQLDRTNSNANVDSMEISEYDLERDINAYIMRFCMEEKKGEKETCFGLKGCDFETSSNDVRGKFPDQRIPLNALSRNPEILKRKESTDAPSQNPKIPEKESTDAPSHKVPDIQESTDVRYIHIPSNNMHVSPLRPRL